MNYFCFHTHKYLLSCSSSVHKIRIKTQLKHPSANALWDLVNLLMLSKAHQGLVIRVVTVTAERKCHCINPLIPYLGILYFPLGKLHALAPGVI